jgi:hypothetical protein
MPRTLNPAEKRYLTRLFPAMIAYVAVMAFEHILFADATPSVPLAWALAIAPAVPILGVIAAMGFYLVDETDEYLRLQHAKASLLATGLMLGVATVWGFLEDFHLVAHAPGYWAFVVFCGALGLARCLIKVRG